MSKNTAKKEIPRVERKRAERRERIVEAATEAIAQSGPADFSINQLAKSLDYTPGALYWYFPSKEALVLEVQSRCFRQLAEDIRSARKRWEAAPRLRDRSRQVQHLYSLLKLAKFYLELERTAPHYPRLITFSLDPRVWLDDATASGLTPVLVELFGEVAAPFVEAQGAGVLAEGEGVRRAVQYWAALQGVLQTSKLSRLSPELFRVYELGMDSARSLLAGWGANPDALAEAVALIDNP